MSNRVPVPRGCGERAIAGLLAVLFGFLSGGCFIGLRGWTPATTTERLFKAGVEHVFFSLSAICIVVAFWSLFAPRWMERIIVRVQDHVIETLLAVIILSGISIFAAFVSQ
jgi:hypothetical protein